MKSTLDGAEFLILSGRRMGNTTRLIDYAIQIIFSGETVVIKDHHESGKNYSENKRLFDLIVRRLEIEHPGAIGKGRIMINRERLIIGPDYENKPLNGGPLSFGFENIKGV